MTTRILALPILLAAGAAAQSPAAPGPGIEKAIAVLHPTQGSSVEGVVQFEKAQGGVKVNARLKGLGQGGHGFHVHEFGDCSAPDGSSAGNHFNPTNEPHGGPKDPKRHVGDMGNIQAGGDGTATAEYVDPRLSFEGSRGIVGRAVIVHEKADDLKSQPSGDAGGRKACGVIGIDSPEPKP
jgi:Cu-Zn family superoxide dismutase